MDKNTIMKSILDSYPYPIVFADKDYIIRFMNRYAEYHYYKERGYKDLIGKSLLDCHDTEKGKEKIRQAFDSLQKNGKEIFLGINTRNQRIYIQGVRDEQGKLIGFFERFELNLEK